MKERGPGPDTGIPHAIAAGKYSHVVKPERGIPGQVSAGKLERYRVLPLFIVRFLLMSNRSGSTKHTYFLHVPKRIRQYSPCPCCPVHHAATLRVTSGRFSRFVNLNGIKPALAPAGAPGEQVTHWHEKVVSYKTGTLFVFFCCRL